MKKLRELVVTVFTLAAAVFFFAVGGTSFLQMISGPAPLEEFTDIHEAEGAYVSYEAAYPVASYAAEYYSGDPDRVSKMGYVVYDQNRQEFFSVVVSEQNTGGLNRLLRNMSVPEKERGELNTTPVMVKGTISLMDSDGVEEVLDAVGGKDSRIPEELYDGAMGQADWYTMENGSINGYKSTALWLCAIAAALNLLIFLVRAAGMVKPKKEVKAPAFDASKGRLELLIAQQRPWIERWCAETRESRNKNSYFAVIIMGVILCAIGILVKYPISYVLSVHLAMGILMGETMGILIWLGSRATIKPDRILDLFRKNIKKQLPEFGAQDTYAEDILEAGNLWAVRETWKEGSTYGVVGNRYWTVFQTSGSVAIIEAKRVAKIETETIAGQVRSGKVRVSYISYIMKCFYRDSSLKKGPDRQLVFQMEDTLGHFMLLIRKRIGDSIEVIAK